MVTEEDMVIMIELRDAIQSLKSVEKNVLLMSIVYGYTQSEIGEQLRLSQASISRILNSTIDQLRSIIK